MDIKVITRHGPSNYGSLLQSIATMKLIEKLGHKCTIIDYERRDERGLKSILASIHKKREWNHNFLKKIAYIAIRYPIEMNAQCKFDKMRKKHLNMTARYSSSFALKGLKADIFMTGSDQVWGPLSTQMYDEAYFLHFAGSETKKIAYSASFGRTDFNDDIVSKYKKMLSNYNAIAVRENSAVELLNQWSIPCAGQVLDPTLMITPEEWSKFIKEDIKGKYILVYQLHNNPLLNDYAKKLAKYTELPLLRISPSFHQIRRGGKLVYLPDLGEFLSYIKNCTYLITDSFHGTAFALTFNKQFLEILPNNKTSSRNQSILQLTGLENRVIIDFNDFSKVNEIIEYNKVNTVLNRERQKSLDILKGFLKIEIK